MENKGTTGLKVSFRIRHELQVKLMAEGRPAQELQVITVSVPAEAILTLPVSIDEDGYASLELKEHHYLIGGSKVGTGDHQFGGECDCCGKRIVRMYLSEYIESYEDIIKLIASNQARKEAVEAKLASRLTAKAEIERIRLKITADVTAKMEMQYQNAYGKVGAIRELIAGKQRIRVAQIQRIIG